MRQQPYSFLSSFLSACIPGIRAEKYPHSIYGDYSRNISGRPDTVRMVKNIFLSPITEKNKLEATTATLEGNTLVYPETDTTTAPVYHKTTIPRGGEYILRLADGTRVWLNSETELEYPVVFTKKQRQVFLKGEAYFEVAPDSLHPFIVKTEQQNLRVLGTSFAIRAYANESVVLTTLETGKVNIHSKGQEVILNPRTILPERRQPDCAKVNTLIYSLAQREFSYSRTNRWKIS